MKRILMVVFFLLVMALNFSILHAAPPVDGFIGVPWGSSQEEVATIMAEKGFIFYKNIISADGEVRDIYKGAFSDHPAFLKFSFQKNIFFGGTVYFQETQNQAYGEMADLLKAKYGRPTNDTSWDTGCYLNWFDVPTTVSPQGNVQIWLMCQYKKTGFYGEPNHHFTELYYGIGKDWARLKTAKDI